MSKADSLREAFLESDPESWSSPATLRRVAAELADLDWPRARVADVGAGRGPLSRLLGETLREQLGLEPREHVFACDLIPASFEYEGVDCRPIAPDGSLPFDDESFDATVSIEVIEHVEDQFAFLRELKRVTRPGGMVIVTTPNTLNANSRVRTLTQGFPLLFDPLPLHDHDPRGTSGHIHPISPYFLAYNAVRVGLTEPAFVVDRVKKSAVWMSLMLSPLLLLGRLAQNRRVASKWPEIREENRPLLAAQGSPALLTSRTAILRTRRP